MEKTKEQAVALRLKSIEGHVRGIIRMTEEGAYCIDILQQVRAVQSALEKCGQVILEDHLNHCVVNAVRTGDANDQERVVSEIMEVFRASSNGRG